MKLSTMLLPTGEFVFIASEAPREDPAKLLGGLVEFRKLAGAAAVFLTDLPIEIDDAMFDENARRAAPAAPAAPEHVEEGDNEPEEGPYSWKTFFPRAQDAAGNAFSVEFTAVAPTTLATLYGDPGLTQPVSETKEVAWQTSPAVLRTLIDEVNQGVEQMEKHRDTFADKLLADNIAAGAKFSPAGLVKLTEEQKENLPPLRLEGELANAVDPNPPLVELSDEEKAALTVPAKPYEPKVGDRVRVKKGARSWGGKEIFDEPIGTVGRIVEVPGFSDRKHDVSVNGIGVFNLFLREDLELVIEYTPQPGDTVLITGPSFYGNSDVKGHTGTVEAVVARDVFSVHVPSCSPNRRAHIHRDNLVVQPKEN